MSSDDVSAATMPAPVPGARAADWALDPAVTFLNHGSFGARMHRVIEAQMAWRRQLEARPVEFLDRRRDELLGAAKERVGGFLGMRPDDFGFVVNATEGVNAVLRSLRLSPGDELVATDHVYNAVRQSMSLRAREAGAAYREVAVPLPVREPAELIEAVVTALGPRTRLLVIDHVTSPTAIVFPVARIAAICAERGIDVLVDGAHAPGMLDLDVTAIGAAYYTGNLHKWVCAPPGAAFLWVRRDRQESVHPLAVSHFFDEGFAAEFSWQGTRDVTTWLTVPDAIDAMSELGWEEVRLHNHQLATWAHAELVRRWQVEPRTPPDGSLLGSMASVPLPPPAASIEDSRTLQRRLYDEHRIEVPIVDWPGGRLVRISCQVYNAPHQYEQLAEAMISL